MAEKLTAQTQAVIADLAADHLLWLAKMDAAVGSRDRVIDLATLQQYVQGDLSVAGGAGFVNVSGAVTLDVRAARAFHHTATGNITGPTFSNVPVSAEQQSSWVWVLAVDASGPYTHTSRPAVTWLDGSSWDDLDLSANAVNIVHFVQVGATTYAALVYTGTIQLDAIAMQFDGDGTGLWIATQAVTLDLGSVSHLAAAGTAATGSLTYEKNGAAVSGSTTFVSGDVLSVIRAGSSAAGAVSIPRYVT